MIGKISDIGELSGEKSPLLPLIYEDFYSCTRESDGVYIQSLEGEKTLLISCRNGFLTLVKLSDNWCEEELASFVSFLRGETVIADFKWCAESRPIPLMRCQPRCFEERGVYSLDATSCLTQYKNVFSLLGGDGDDFDAWYRGISLGINSGRRVAVYVGEDFKSTAVCNAILEDTAIISGVYTRSDCRLQGYGAKAVKGLLHKLYLRNITSAILWCEEKNVAFYEKIGFIRTGEIYYREEIV